MRRIFAVALVALIVFLFTYGILSPVKATVDAFMLNTMGPTFFNAISALYTGVITTVGVGGFAAIVLGFGFLIGIVAHFLWVKADWKIWRWSQKRASSKLGTTTVTHLPSTPVGATTRPTPTTAQPAPTPVVEAPVEEKKEESEAT